MTTRHDVLSRFAAIGEICLVLVVGEMIYGIALVATFDPRSAEVVDSPDLVRSAAITAVHLTLRFGPMIALGFGWLWWRSRKTPRDCGFTRNGWPLSRLIVAGAVLYAVSFLPFACLLLTHEYFPLRDAAELWDIGEDKLPRVDFWIYTVPGAVLLLPLYQELVFRGYMRARLSEDFGPMGGVLVGAFLFVLVDPRYYGADALVLTTLLFRLFGVLTWAYVTYRCGSLVPAMVAHALTNVPFPHSAAVLIGIVAACAIAILLARNVVGNYFGCFIADWRSADQRRIGFGILVVSAFAVPALVLVATTSSFWPFIWIGIWVTAFILAILLSWRARGSRA